MKSEKNISTKNIKVPEGIVDQVLGQDEAVKIIKKAAQQRRHVLLIGEPGTGKSMLGMALAELLPKSDLKDTLAYPNLNDENNPYIKTLNAGKGRDEAQKYLLDANQSMKNNTFYLLIFLGIGAIFSWLTWKQFSKYGTVEASIMTAAAGVVFGIMILMTYLSLNMGPRMFQAPKNIAPKVIVDNYNKKIAPFFDATGAHAGALLGDVLHDPFQSFNSSNNIAFVENKNNLVNGNLGEFVDRKLKEYSRKILKKDEKNYEAIFLPKNELAAQGETNGSISPVEVLSCNRYDYVGEMIKLTTSENKELIVTPEHKIAIWKNGKTEYVEAQQIKKGDEVVAQAEDIIIDEHDIFNTYDKRQQEQCVLYYQYQRIRTAHPTWGYKKIAKAMNQPIGKTRRWHARKHIPTPIQTTQWLKKRKLLPFKIDNKKLPLIAKVLGTTFGDGGIFANLNAIFLSSSELEATEEFGIDLMKIFGYSIDNNMRTIQGGRNGTSFCYQNTNRNIIRFFAALGAPIGNKTKVDLIVPAWIRLSEGAEREFYGSLFGSEIGISSNQKGGVRIEFGITGDEMVEQNRLQFLGEIKWFLDKKGIETGKILSYTRKAKEGSKMFRFICSQKLETGEIFSKNINLNYCRYKRDNLKKYLDNFRERTYKKYQYYIDKGYGAQRVMEKLELKPNELYSILNNKGTIIA